jgi:hypothetical protein
MAKYLCHAFCVPYSVNHQSKRDRLVRRQWSFSAYIILAAVFTLYKENIAPNFEPYFNVVYHNSKKASKLVRISSGSTLYERLE